MKKIRILCLYCFLIFTVISVAFTLDEDEPPGFSEKWYNSDDDNIADIAVDTAETAAPKASTAAHTVTEPAAIAPSSRRPPPQPPVRISVPQMTPVSPAAVVRPAVVPPVAPAPPADSSPVPVVPRMSDPYDDGTYRVQVGAFSDTGNAQRCFDRLVSAGFSPCYEQYGSIYRVIVIGIEAADMTNVVRCLNTAGFSDVWIRRER